MSLLLAASWLFGFVLNAAWKITLVFAAAWLLARLVQPLGPRAEHRVWVSALLLELAMPFAYIKDASLRLGAVWERITAFAHAGKGAGDGEVRVIVSPGRGVGDLLHLPRPILLAVTLAYCGITVFFAARLLLGLWRTHQLSRTAAPAELSRDASACWARLCAGFQLPEAQIALSQRVAGPMIVGVHPMRLLLPPEFLADVSEIELEAALAHEAAHMRRRDFAKNLLYSILALPVAFHPLVRRTLAGIRESRELVCDDMAAASLAGRRRYARSLVRLAELLTAGPALPEPGALQAIGIFDGNIFERRIMRLTHPPMPVRGLRRFATIALCALATTAVCGSALAWRVEINPRAASEPAQETGPNAPTKAPKHVFVPSGTMQGNLLTNVRPVYPPEAKKAGVEGEVVLRATIGKDGTVENLRVVSGPKELQKSSLDAVRQWTYKPYLLNGDPVDVETTINVIYTLAKGKEKMPAPPAEKE